jgi:hypothetical protein
VGLLATLDGPRPAGSLIAMRLDGRVNPMALCERERVVLEIERGWWLEGQSKTEIVRSRLSVSLSRYNQILGELVNRQDAEQYDPLVVRRTRRAKQDRRRASMGMRPATGRWDR